jgi:signal transduction histidine kinase
MPSADWESSISRILQLAAERMSVERVSFWSLSDHPARIRCEAGYVATTNVCELGATLFERDLPEYFAALRRVVPLKVEDVSTDPRCRGLREYSGMREITSMLDVPVWAGGQLAGVLCHEHVGTKRSWTPREEEFALGVAQVVASALEARRHKVANAAAFRGAFLDNVSRTLLQSLEADEIARRAVDLFVPILGEVAVVFTVNYEGSLELRAIKHADLQREPSFAEAARAVISKGGPGALPLLAMRQRQALLQSDVEASAFEAHGAPPAMAALFRELGVRTTMAVPISVAGYTLGALAFFDSTRRFGPDDLELAKDVADRVGSALENARLYAIAREAIRARDEFLGLAAHELRTPLTSLRLAADDALRRARRGGDAEQEKRVEGIVRQTRRLDALVGHMLEASTLRSDALVTAPEPCDLAEIVERCVSSAADRARQVGCAITRTLQSPLFGLWDGVRLERVVQELLDNALKFCAGKPIEVDLTHDETHAVLTVRDHGAGIDAGRQDSIFVPFQRGVSAENYGGLGLGLFIARAIVEAHHGSIRVTSQDGQGSTFVVRLPRNLGQVSGTAYPRVP